ncbi:MAG: DUF3021 domain-containing protein [Streptococcaceae bacterium]|jgi:hypothetical protein|nr:DUF3021 domain-containing protein [Streptococcaceae bacterium]
MIKLKGLLRRIMIGIGFSVFFSLSVPLFYQEKISYSRLDLLVVIFAGGLISLYTYLFKIEALNDLSAFVLHFFLTGGTALVINYHFNRNFFATFGSYLVFFYQFLAVYLLIWVLLFLLAKKEVKAVNQQLKANQDYQAMKEK